MLKRISHFFIFISVTITLSHGIVAHHHHFEEVFIESHQHSDNDDHHDHSLFSFGQLDESFIFSQSYPTISNDVNTTLFLIPSNQLLALTNSSIARTDFITHQEFPPPEDYFHSASHRGPPTI